jgi:hypothetical protein
MESKIFEFAQI